MALRAGSCPPVTSGSPDCGVRMGCERFWGCERGVEIGANGGLGGSMETGISWSRSGSARSLAPKLVSLPASRAGLTLRGRRYARRNLGGSSSTCDGRADKCELGWPGRRPKTARGSKTSGHDDRTRAGTRSGAPRRGAPLSARSRRRSPRSRPALAGPSSSCAPTRNKGRPQRPKQRWALRPPRVSVSRWEC